MLGSDYTKVFLGWDKTAEVTEHDEGGRKEVMAICERLCREEANRGVIKTG